MVIYPKCPRCGKKITGISQPPRELTLEETDFGPMRLSVPGNQIFFEPCGHPMGYYRLKVEGKKVEGKSIVKISLEALAD